MVTVTSMSNPFSPGSQKDLFILCSGVVANEEATKVLQNAYVKGDERVKQFSIPGQDTYVKRQIYFPRVRKGN